MYKFSSAHIYYQPSSPALNYAVLLSRVCFSHILTSASLYLCPSISHLPTHQFLLSIYITSESHTFYSSVQNCTVLLQKTETTEQWDIIPSTKWLCKLIWRLARLLISLQHWFERVAKAQLFLCKCPMQLTSNAPEAETFISQLIHFKFNSKKAKHCRQILIAWIVLCKTKKPSIFFRNQNEIYS